MPRIWMNTAADSLRVTNLYPRALHHALLATCGVEATREFWLRHPLVFDGRPKSLRELGLHLERNFEMTPLAWVLHSQNSLEDFLLERGIAIEAFADSLLQHSNRASFIPSKVGLAWISPLIAQLFRAVDPYRVVVRMLILGAKLASPGVISQELRHYKLSSDARASILLLTYRELWLGTLPAWDAPVFTSRMHRNNPRALGLPPFERVSALADARTATEITTGSDAACHNGEFWIDGVPHGTVEPFSTYCKRHAFCLPDFGQPDPLVVVIHKAWSCPRRKRAVLTEGCAYGAPAYVFRFEWQVSSRRATKYLKSLLDESLGNTAQSDGARLRRLSAAFLGDAPHTRCKFIAGHDTMYVNDKYLCKGVPARILRRCMQIRDEEGRVTFEYREFKQDGAFISHPKNTGFEVRLSRLREALKASDSGLWIEQHEPGRFILHSDGPVTLDEST